MEAKDQAPLRPKPLVDNSYYTVTQRILRYPPPSFTMYTDVVEGEVVKDIPSFGEARKIARAMDKPRDFDEHGYMRFYNPRIMWFDGKGHWLSPEDSPGYNEWIKSPEALEWVRIHDPDSLPCLLHKCGHMACRQ